MSSRGLEAHSKSSSLKFSPGDVVRHKDGNLRGVVIEVDESFSGPDERLINLTSRRGPKREPWYYVLFEGQNDAVYVAQCHLYRDESGHTVEHPLLESVFTEFRDGRYIRLNH